jgi:hypothetical protein
MLPRCATVETPVDRTGYSRCPRLALSVLAEEWDMDEKGVIIPLAMDPIGTGTYRMAKVIFADYFLRPHTVAEHVEPTGQRSYWRVRGPALTGRHSCRRPVVVSLLAMRTSQRKLSAGRSALMKPHRSKSPPGPASRDPLRVIALTGSALATTRPKVARPSPRARTIPCAPHCHVSSGRPVRRSESRTREYPDSPNAW